ncbi:hypothetical protein [Natrinema altunense]|uniref:Uncharacterized protein n=2 Tax=Natrinema altunense TaxID=222984 RepID=L9ZZX8_NATA2|nr:hypothetical protein [Natrinema altunense]ELY92050.1 hypothetical protein C485_00865 [Natrinema altunense JCM 12890]RZH67890.1 hypothetical protein ELS17_10220 [Natrinema altunense]
MGESDTNTTAKSDPPDLAYDEGEESEEQFRNPEQHDIETLRFVCDESRNVIDHQIDDLNDIDDKALRTVRITMVVVGFLVAAAQVENADPIFNRITTLGGLFLLLSITTGVLTYSASNLDLGPGPDYLIDVLSESNSEKEERIEATRSYAYWMYKNETVLQKNGWYLIITQFLLIFGMLLLAYGAWSGVTDDNFYDFMLGMIVT